MSILKIQFQIAHQTLDAVPNKSETGCWVSPPSSFFYSFSTASLLYYLENKRRRNPKIKMLAVHNNYAQETQCTQLSDYLLFLLFSVITVGAGTGDLESSLGSIGCTVSKMKLVFKTVRMPKVPCRRERVSVCVYFYYEYRILS